MSLTTKAREFWDDFNSENMARFKLVLAGPHVDAMSSEERERYWHLTALNDMNKILDLGGTPVPDWRVLDLGCGAGRLLLVMRHMFAQVDGVDFSPKMLTLAKRYCEGVGVGRLILNDGETLAGLASTYYDLVYSMLVFQHIRSRRVALSYASEVHRVLKYGGVFRLQVHEVNENLGAPDEEGNPRVQYGMAGNGYTPAALVDLLGEGGFQSVEVEQVPPWLWATAYK